MKKTLAMLAVIFCLLGSTTVWASSKVVVNTKNNSIEETKTVESNNKSDTVSQLVEIKDNEKKTLEDYQKAYGSDTYGLTAFILSRVQIYSIPFCFVGIAISAIYQYVIGIRKLDTQEKGLVMMVTFITLLVICQVLPLAFAIVVKFGRR